jgi:exopolysaccharide production protein ExoQ
LIAVKYYPHQSRYYDQWSHQPIIIGLGLDKNTSGMAVFVSGLALIWMLFELRSAARTPLTRTKFLQYGVLLAVTLWLLLQYRSATAFACLSLGALMLGTMRIAAIRAEVRRLTSYALAALGLLVLVGVTGLGDDVVAGVSKALGRDPTLHGRGEIWRRVLHEDINPVTGVGFYSFWTPERNKRLSEGFYYSLGEAHNGYIETYLNHGLAGVTLLLGMLVASAHAAKRAVLAGSAFGTLRLALLITILFYNISESAFDRLVPIWFALILAGIDCPPTPALSALEISPDSDAFLRRSDVGLA